MSPRAEVRSTLRPSSKLLQRLDEFGRGEVLPINLLRHPAIAVEHRYLRDVVEAAGRFAPGETHVVRQAANGGRIRARKMPVRIDDTAVTPIGQHASRGVVSRVESNREDREAPGPSASRATFTTSRRCNVMPEQMA